MADILMAFGLVLCGVGFAIQGAVLYSFINGGKRRADYRQEQALDEKVQESMDDEARRSKAMAEGFDNLMRYSVNGSDGFGSADSEP